MKLGEYVPEKIPLLDFSGSGLVNEPFAAKNWNQLQNLKAWRFVKNYKNALNQKGLEMDLMMFPLKQKVPPAAEAWQSHTLHISNQFAQ